MTAGAVIVWLCPACDHVETLDGELDAFLRNNVRIACDPCLDDPEGGEVLMLLAEARPIHEHALIACTSCRGPRGLEDLGRSTCSTCARADTVKR